MGVVAGLYMYVVVVPASYFSYGFSVTVSVTVMEEVGVYV